MQNSHLIELDRRIAFGQRHHHCVLYGLGASHAEGHIGELKGRRLGAA